MHKRSLATAGIRVQFVLSMQAIRFRGTARAQPQCFRLRLAPCEVEEQPKNQKGN